MDKELSSSVSSVSINKLNSMNKFVVCNTDRSKSSFSLGLIRELLPRFLSCLENSNNIAVQLIETQEALDDAELELKEAYELLKELGIIFNS